MTPPNETRPALAVDRASGCSLLRRENSTENTPPCPQNQLRLRLLAAKIHGLGPVVLGYLFAELQQGRDLIETLEDYARLEPYAALIEAYAVTPGTFLVKEGAP